MDTSIFATLLDAPSTAKRIGISQAQARAAVKAGHIVQRGTEKIVDAEGNGTRGRPAFVYALTPKLRRKLKKAQS